MRTLLGLARRLRAERGQVPQLRRFVPVLLRSALPGRARLIEPRRASRPSGSPPVRPAPPPAPSPLTVFSVLRNGVSNGYPFVEAYGSWASWAERIVVVDGGSDDGTREALDALAALVPQFEVVERPWPASSTGGSAIAQLSNEAVALAGDGESRLMYVQADEIYTERQRAIIRGWDAGALEFAGCVNFWNSPRRVLANEFPMTYVRLLPPGADAVSVGDGWTFAVDGAPVTTTPERYLHYGWCFPVNILRKHVSHARLYPDSPCYRLRGVLAGRMLAAGKHDPRLLDALAPHYRAVPFTGEQPTCMRHLLDAEVYDPNRGLEALAAGARW